MIRIGSGIVILSALITLGGCRTGETPGQGTINAQITCNSNDSLLATIYMAGGDMAAASEWCPCGESGACSIEFGSLGYGEYVLGVGQPDTTYQSTEGAEGFVRQLGYYRQDSLASDPESATAIALSADQPSANVEVRLEQ